MITAFLLHVWATCWLVVGVVWLASRRPGYRSRSATISELGESGAADRFRCAYGVFLPVGVLLVAGAALLRTVSPDAALLALCLGIGYLGAAFFPCDPGSPMRGSTRQELHNLAGGIQYLGGAWMLHRLAETQGGMLRLAFVLAVVGLIGVSFQHAGRGAVQRLGELGLFGGLLLAEWARLP